MTAAGEGQAALGREGGGYYLENTFRLVLARKQP